jgi:hypothetical protein
MARQTRIDFPGAWYHVLNRGIEKRLIFRPRLSVMYRRDPMNLLLSRLITNGIRRFFAFFALFCGYSGYTSV